MTTAVYLLVYGAVMTWLSPMLLTRLTRCGLNPRLGVAAWVISIVGALVAWTVAVGVVVVAGVRASADSAAIVVCLELLGMAEREATPGRLSVLALVATALLVTTIVTVRVGRSVLSSRSRSREHASAARLIGLPTHRPDVFVVTAERPAAYCVVGRPNAIVVTSAAVDSLGESELEAVLAHEAAHISGRHHHLLMVLRALAVVLPHLPLFTRGATAVAELLEMCADDSAARSHGTRPLVNGMVMLAGPLGVAGSLAVAATAVGARALRLLEPAHRGTCWCHRVLVSATITAIIGVPVIVNVICQH